MIMHIKNFDTVLTVNVPYVQNESGGIKEMEV